MQKGLKLIFCSLSLFSSPSSSEDVCKHGFTVIVDMRGSKWDSIKPLLKILQESFPCCIHIALIIKPDNFWQKQRTNFGSSKFEFEVRDRLMSSCVERRSWMRMLMPSELTVNLCTFTLSLHVLIIACFNILKLVLFC